MAQIDKTISINNRYRKAEVWGWSILHSEALNKGKYANHEKMICTRARRQYYVPEEAAPVSTAAPGGASAICFTAQVILSKPALRAASMT